MKSAAQLRAEAKDSKNDEKPFIFYNYTTGERMDRGRPRKKLQYGPLNRDNSMSNSSNLSTNLSETNESQSNRKSETDETVYECNMATVTKTKLKRTPSSANVVTPVANSSNVASLSSIKSFPSLMSTFSKIKSKYKRTPISQFLHHDDSDHDDHEYEEFDFNLMLLL